MEFELNTVYLCLLPSPFHPFLPSFLFSCQTLFSSVLLHRCPINEIKKDGVHLVEVWLGSISSSYPLLLLPSWSHLSEMWSISHLPFTPHLLAPGFYSIISMKQFLITSPITFILSTMATFWASSFLTSSITRTGWPLLPSWNILSHCLLHIIFLSCFSGFPSSASFGVLPPPHDKYMFEFFKALF